jgi:N-methylhydantoinase A/oxoprolinase/acetone carboxylase beta subunit
MSEPAPRYRLGVDVGGTHTDLVLLDTVSGNLMVERSQHAEESGARRAQSA